MKKIMKSIFSIKNENFHKVLTIGGIKFKIRNKYKELSKLYFKQIEHLKYENRIKIFSHWQDDNYIFCDSLLDAFIRQTSSKVFHHMCEEYFFNKDLKDFHNQEILIYLASLIEQEKIDEAKILLGKYVVLHNNKDIWRFLLVSKFAKAHNITDKNIEKTCCVFDKLKESRKNKLFEKVIEGKTVAVVGNSPSGEGKNKGHEIDSHDIVIRFNNYKTKGYEEDYGSKTDIWVKCSSDDIDHNIRNENLQLIVYEPDYIHYPIIDGYLEVLTNSSINIDYFDYQDHVPLRKTLNIFPSSGLVTIEKILKLSVKAVNFYGFSFQQEKQEGCAIHYFKDKNEQDTIRRSSWHSYNEESKYLKQIIGVFSEKL